MSTGAFLSALMIRAQSPPSLAQIQQTIAGLDPAIAVAHYRSIDDLVSESVKPQTFETGALALFAVLALILSAVGVYGVLAYLLSQRTHEIGIRIALGAERRDVVFLALRQGMTPVGIGVCIGLAGAAALMRLISSLLFGVTPSDPLSIAAVIAILSLVAFAACYIPTRRVTRIHPTEALRHE
jgi:putative ABC transport system permease protein